MTTVAEAIDKYAPNAMVRLAMRLGALLEGGSLGGGPFAVGDQGTGIGPYQVGLRSNAAGAHLLSQYGFSGAKGKLQDPAFSVQFMLPAYTAAAAQIPASLWQSNPELAAEKTARAAERPLYDYLDPRSYGQGGVDAKWATASGGSAPASGGAAAGGGAATGTTAAAAGTAASTNPCEAPGLFNPAGWVGYFFCRLEQDAKPFFISSGAVLAGGALVVAGLWRAVSRSQTYQNAKGGAGSVPDEAAGPAAAAGGGGEAAAGGAAAGGAAASAAKGAVVLA